MDAVVLIGTGAFLAADRHIESNVPNSHFTLYQDTSDIAIAGLATSLAGVWLYGIKTDHQHARETGELELETLVNTFLIYTPCSSFSDASVREKATATATSSSTTP